MCHVPDSDYHVLIFAVSAGLQSNAKSSSVIDCPRRCLTVLHVLHCCTGTGSVPQTAQETDCTLDWWRRLRSRVVSIRPFKPSIDEVLEGFRDIFIRVAQYPAQIAFCQVRPIRDSKLLEIP